MVAADAPLPGFVIKLAAADGTRHYVNVGSHPVIERPLDPQDREVNDAHLRTRGLENLRVPLLTGLARTVVIPGGEGEEAVCIDVVFNPAVLAVALAGTEDEVDDGEGAKPRLKRAVGKDGDIDPDLAKFVRIRVVELALKNAEDDLHYKIGRNYTLPRGVTYRGGVGGGKQPVPMPQLRQLAAAVEAERQRKEMAAAPGPWRSKRDAAGLANTARIEELPADGGSGGKPLLKKGFLNSDKRAIYPEGSDEGMLYNAKNSGDPLGYIPKGLRSRVNVVDTATTDAETQKKMMEDYADGKRVPKPEKSREGAKPSKPSETDALRELIPDQSEMMRIARETDPNEFMNDLAAFGSLLGVSDGLAGTSTSAPSNPIRQHSASTAPPSTDPPQPQPPTVPAGPQLPACPAGPSSVAVDISDARAVATALAGGAEATPVYTLEEVDGAVSLRVQLPELAALGDTQVDLSEHNFRLHAPGQYKLELAWPRAGAAGLLETVGNHRKRRERVDNYPKPSEKLRNC